MFDRGLNRANQKLGTEIKKVRKAKDALEILTGIQLHKLKSLKLIRGAIETFISLRAKLHFTLNIKIACFLHCSDT
jgi:hypothetical protein